MGRPVVPDHAHLTFLEQTVPCRGGGGVPLETRKVLIGHRNREITTHYSAPEPGDLLAAAERVCGHDSGKTPALPVLREKAGVR